MAEQWIEQGIQQGIQQGHHQGMLQAARDMLYEAISSKFGAIPEDVSGKIKKIKERETLRALFRQAILSETLDAFRKALQKI